VILRILYLVFVNTGLHKDDTDTTIAFIYEIQITITTNRIFSDCYDIFVSVHTFYLRVNLYLVHARNQFI
jgi:hypothetical protein